ncbi:hypothetical protein JR316_0012153 [Psilocybe cubensis]|uniref:Uncharacterized protein n=1 Tax=Psilocybe cubensis TaxID=181762 RepID=A0ACB8GHW5_PSICU|nr:hypothetical protein JR316_0012153 [Psilocybe cubensis]KAH9475050.1 hypothetical protein JR316_0012153 [Psilocybe cubensis]
MPPGALIEGEHSSLLELHHYPINNSLHGSSPTFLETTPHQMPPDQSSFEQEGNYEETIEIPNVPLSSSPPDFTSSSPRSNSSGEYDSNKTSTSNSSLSNISSSSPLDLTTTEGFGQKLHQLLLEALRERELRDKTDFSFYSDSSVVQTPEISSVPHEKASLCQIDSSFGEISPISFEVPKNSISSQKIKMPPQYRIIKRALSNGLVQGENETLTKRQKQGKDVNVRTYDQIYARRTASLRRAESLKSVDSDGRQAPLVPTVPATPIPAKRHTAATLPVPIIAPPSEHVAKLPMSSETFAKIRLERLLQRETEGRMADGLLPGISIRPPPCMIQNRGECSPLDDDSKLSIEDDIRFDWEVAIGLGSKRRKTIVAWLLKVYHSKFAKPTSAHLSLYRYCRLSQLE